MKLPQYNGYLISTVGFRNMASVTTVLSMHLCVSRPLRVDKRQTIVNSRCASSGRKKKTKKSSYPLQVTQTPVMHTCIKLQCFNPALHRILPGALQLSNFVWFYSDELRQPWLSRRSTHWWKYKHMEGYKDKDKEKRQRERWKEKQDKKTRSPRSNIGKYDNFDTI